MVPREKIHVLLATARHNPEFARRLADAMPVAQRPELGRVLARPAESTLCRPGVAKCRPSAGPRAAQRPQNKTVAVRAENPMSAQLRLFARSITRIG